MFGRPHELRYQILNPEGMTPDDVQFVELMAKYPPITKFQSGDLARLVEVPNHLRGQGPLPGVWLVQAVYSRYQFALYQLVQQHRGYLDWTIMQIEVARRLLPTERRETLLYAKAFPEGQWVTSELFPEDCLYRSPLKAPIRDGWEPTLDELSTPFLGYAQTEGIVLDFAPDIYKDERYVQRPLVIEEGAFHQACLLGMEELCMVPSVHEGSFRQHGSDIFDYDD